VGLLTVKGDILSYVEEGLPDPKTLTCESLAQKIKALVDQVCVKHEDMLPLLAVGIGCPGQSRRGILVAASNLPTLKKAPLADAVSWALGGVPTTLLNDADAAMAAELWSERSGSKYAGVNNAAMLTLGTGIGSAVMLSGNLHEGANGLIEAGHMIVNPLMGRKCGCGQVGCAESHSSAFNTALRMNELLVTQPGGGSKLVKNAKDVFERAAKGDPAALTTLDATVEYLAILCVNICRVIDPEVIILAGGMAQAGEPLLAPLRARLMDRSWKILPTDVRIEVGGDVEKAGMVGAALAALRSLDPEKAALTKSSVSSQWRRLALASAATLTLGAGVLASRSLPREWWGGGGVQLSAGDILKSLSRENKVLGAQLLLGVTHVLVGCCYL